MATFDTTFGLDLPGRFNLCPYYLDHNVEAGRGDKTAVIVGAESRTYAEILRRTCQLTSALRASGLRPEERVLIVLPDGFEFVETWCAVVRAGGVFAMVNPLLKAKDFAYAIEYTKAAAVVTHASVWSEIDAAARLSPHVRRVFLVGGEDEDDLVVPYEAALAEEDPEGELAAVEPTGPDDLAGWLFTSGSTGEPKACVHTHGDFAYATETYALQVAGYREDDVCLSVPKLFFGYATGTNLMFPFRVGATVVLFEGRATADEVLDQIEAHRPTFLTGVPTLFNNVLKSPRAGAASINGVIASSPVPASRRVLRAGECAAAALAPRRHALPAIAASHDPAP